MEAAENIGRTIATGGMVRLGILAFLCLTGWIIRPSEAAAQGYTVTSIDFPGAFSTSPTEINSGGQIVGSFASSTNAPAQGFVYSGGVYSAIDVPGAFGTTLTAINDSGQIVGFIFSSTGGGNQGFLYSGNNFSPINVPGAFSTSPTGINSGEQIVGSFVSSTNAPAQGFVYSGSVYSAIDVPGAFGTIFTAINDSGQIVGFTFSSTGGGNQGFLYSGNNFSPINVPGAFSTSPTGINSRGQIVGSFASSTNAPAQGFVYSGGIYTTLELGSGTNLKGINDAGQIVGYTFSNTGGGDQGLLATPNSSAASVSLLASVLPDSRSIEVAANATAFATILNTGNTEAMTCSIAPATSVAANFIYQTTDPVTNTVIGTPDTPATVPAGGGTTFVLSFTPTAAFAPTEIVLTYNCVNAANAAPSVVGLNTLNLSASTTPVPDIIAVNATSDPGYLDIPGVTGTGDFAVATENLGIAAQITVSANTGTSNLPVTLLVCETDPTSGNCLSSPHVNVTTTIAANATPTFGIFATGSAAVTDSPGANRVFVTFTDASGVLRGETSVAVRTQ